MELFLSASMCSSSLQTKALPDSETQPPSALPWRGGCSWRSRGNDALGGGCGELDMRTASHAARLPRRLLKDAGVATPLRTLELGPSRALCNVFGGRLDDDVVGSAQFMHFHQKVFGHLLILGAGEAGRAGGVLLAHRKNFVGVNGAGPWASFHRLRAAHHKNSTSAAGTIALARSAFPPRPARQQGLTAFPLFVASAIARGAILIRLKALIPPSLPVFLARRKIYHRVAEPPAVIPKAERAFPKKPLSL